MSISDLSLTASLWIAAALAIVLTRLVLYAGLLAVITVLQE